jgi:hypothetical protein
MPFLQREVVHALLGFTGTVVIECTDGFTLANDLHLSDSDHSVLGRLLLAGFCYRELEHFISIHLFQKGFWDSDNSRTCLVASFATGIEECLRPYRSLVLALEQRCLSLPSTSLLGLQLGLGEFELSLPALHGLTASIVKHTLSATAMIDTLHAAISNCTHCLQGWMQVVLQHSQRMLHSQVVTWLMHGELMSASHGFFIQKVGRRHVLVDQIDTCDQHPLGGGTLAHLLYTQNAHHNYADWVTFVVSAAQTPNALPMRTAERMLFIGKVARAFRLSAHHITSNGTRSPSVRKHQRADCSAGDGGYVDRNESLAVEFALSRNVDCQENAAVAEVAAEAAGYSWARNHSTRALSVNITHDKARSKPRSRSPIVSCPISVGIEMRHEFRLFETEFRSLRRAGSVLRLAPPEPVLTRMHASASRLFWFHLTGRGLFCWLSSIKAYLLLGRGTVFHRLLEALRPLMHSHPPCDFDPQASFDLALCSESMGSDLELGHLSLSLVHCAEGTAVYDVWRNLSLAFAVRWPLDVLFQPDLRARYSELSSFLLVVKRVQMELHSVWKTQTRRRRAGTPWPMMPFWRLRTQMAFFVDNLQYYLQVHFLSNNKSP